MTDIQYHSAMSSVGSTNTIDEFFSCDEEDSDSRSSSRTKSLNPDHIEIEIDETSMNFQYFCHPYATQPVLGKNRRQ